MKEIAAEESFTIECIETVPPAKGQGELRCADQLVARCIDRRNRVSTAQSGNENLRVPARMT